MISYEFDIYAFLTAVRNENYFEAIFIARKEAGEASQLTRGGRIGAPKARSQGADRYADQLGAFVYFLEQGARTTGINVSNGLYNVFLNTAKTFEGVPAHIQSFIDAEERKLQ